MQLTIQRKILQNPSNGLLFIIIPRKLGLNKGDDVFIQKNKTEGKDNS